MYIIVRHATSHAVASLVRGFRYIPHTYTYIYFQFAIRKFSKGICCVTYYYLQHFHI